jgi:hypothetical protein
MINESLSRIQPAFYYDAGSSGENSRESTSYWQVSFHRFDQYKSKII